MVYLFSDGMQLNRINQILHWSSVLLKNIVLILPIGLRTWLKLVLLLVRRVIVTIQILFVVYKTLNLIQVFRWILLLIIFLWRRLSLLEHILLRRVAPQPRHARSRISYHHWLVLPIVLLQLGLRLAYILRCSSLFINSSTLLLSSHYRVLDGGIVANILGGVHSWLGRLAHLLFVNCHQRCWIFIIFWVSLGRCHILSSSD